MKIYAALGLAALMTGAGISGAHAQGSIYVYNFNDVATGSTPSDANTAALFSVDRVNQGAKANGSTLSSTFVPITTVNPTTGATSTAAGITNFAGTTVNADNSDISGQALALVGQGNNGNYLQATANLTGFQNIGFSFAGQATGTGFKSDTLSYSTDGGATFTQLGNAFALPASFTAAGSTPQTFDFSGITALNNNANAQFRLTFDGATSASGNNRLDNLIISGTAGTPITAPVPEASTTVSLGLMLALGGLAFAVKKEKANVAL